MDVQMTQFWVFAVFVLVGTILCGALQVCFAGRKSKGWGMIIPALDVAFAAFMIFAVCFMFLQATPWENSIGTNRGDTQLQINYIIDEEENDIAAFSNLKVKDPQIGEMQYYSLEFDKEGHLIGGKEALKYKKEAEILAEGMNFSGTSVSDKDLTKIYKEAHTGAFSPAIYLILLSLLPLFIHSVIYVIMRKRLKKANAVKGIEKMRIADL